MNKITKPCRCGYSPVINVSSNCGDVYALFSIFCPNEYDNNHSYTSLIEFFHLNDKINSKIIALLNKWNNCDN